MAKSVRNRFKKKSFVSTLSVKVAGLTKIFFLSLMPYILSLTLAGVLFGGIIAYAMNSPVFELKEVKILNIGTLTPAQSFRFCELNPGENLISLGLVGVQQVIKKKHPEWATEDGLCQKCVEYYKRAMGK